jgi:hypothetical protein
MIVRLLQQSGRRPAAVSYPSLKIENWKAVKIDIYLTG